METNVLRLVVVAPVGVAWMVVTSTVKASTTGITVSATMCKWNNHKVTRNKCCDVFAYLFNDTDGFMTRVCVTVVMVNVFSVAPKVRPTDTGPNDLDNDIIFGLKAWFFDFSNGHLTGFFINSCFHIHPILTCQ